MRRIVLAALVLAVAGTIWLTVGQRTRSDPPPQAPEGQPEASAWHPTTAEIAHELGPASTSDTTGARAGRFCLLFQKRYRESGQAIKVQVSQPGRLRLTCAASMSPWEKAHLAMQLTREADTVLGQVYEVDIVDSYIGAPQRLVAELRWQDAGRRATVVYDEAFARTPVRHLSPQIAPLRDMPAVQEAIQLAPRLHRGLRLHFAP